MIRNTTLIIASSSIRLKTAYMIVAEYAGIPAIHLNENGYPGVGANDGYKPGKDGKGYLNNEMLRLCSQKIKALDDEKSIQKEICK